MHGLMFLHITLDYCCSYNAKEKGKRRIFAFAFAFASLFCFILLYRFLILYYVMPCQASFSLLLFCPFFFQVQVACVAYAFASLVLFFAFLASSVFFSESFPNLLSLSFSIDATRRDATRRHAVILIELLTFDLRTSIMDLQ